MNGTVRLVNGKKASEGSVQICVNGVWGHVCGPHFIINGLLIMQGLYAANLDTLLKVLIKICTVYLL